MKIEQVNFYYLSSPVIRDIGDGSQDALLVRVEAGGYVGWGECESSPLVSIASWNCPMSHSACKPLSASILGKSLNNANDIRRINALVRKQSADLLQADHTLSGIDIALWDLLGKKLNEPVWRLLGFKRTYPKTAYASLLFANNPQETYQHAQKAALAGFRAVKFGWGSYGRGTIKQDANQVRAAREGLGWDKLLMVDAGAVWGENITAALKRLPALEENEVAWLEEPFVCGALHAYRQLSECSCKVKLAGGEGCHNLQQVRSMIDYAGLGYVQVDSGRIGGITTAKQAADYARINKVQFVNHTFTTHLALSASLQPYAGTRSDALCEFPFAPSKLAEEFTRTKLVPDNSGQVHLPDKPGLGIELDLTALKKYLVEVEIKVGGKDVFSSLSLELFTQKNGHMKQANRGRLREWLGAGLGR